MLVSVSCSAPERDPIATTVPTPTAVPSPIETPTPDPFELARSYESGTPADLIARIERAPYEQAHYRQLITRVEWRDEVFAALPSSLRGFARANVEAGAELRKLTAPRPKLPPWSIVKPPSAAVLRKAYDAADEEFGVDWSYLAAIHLVETRMGRIRGDSTAGAKGPMQFLPSTWERWGEGDINDPHDAISAAARYLRASGAPNDMHRALFAYNHSDHYVRAIELYAEQMRDDPRTYTAYHGWQVYYRMTKGDALLYEGWSLTHR